MPPTVRLLIGNPKPYLRDSAFSVIPCEYHKTSADLLEFLAGHITSERETLASNLPLHCVGLLALHRRREIELEIYRCFDGIETQYRVDVKGELIEPWPDDFFELEFYCRVPGAKE